MAEETQVAQSYAKAVNALCTDRAKAGSWSKHLEFLAAVANDPSMRKLLEDSGIGRARQTEAMLAVVQGKLDAEAANLVRLMGENGRLALLPLVQAEFEVLRAEADARIDATVISAKALTPAQAKEIEAALSKRLDKSVSIESKVDESLIGGAIIHAGDLVIDGSIRGGLAKLASALNR
ncbi:MAG: F0F1 ATP synthase subunit delta [Halothiobacillaceae bacterium]